MPVELDQVNNCPTLKPCAGLCSGYETRSNCPPLIVLAVAATQNIVPLPAFEEEPEVYRWQ
jgi:predicted metal-binding protein